MNTHLYSLIKQQQQLRLLLRQLNRQKQQLEGKQAQVTQDIFSRESAIQSALDPDPQTNISSTSFIKMVEQTMTAKHRLARLRSREKALLKQITKTETQLKTTHDLIKLGCLQQRRTIPTAQRSLTLVLETKLECCLLQNAALLARFM